MGVYGGVEKNWAALTNTGRTHVATKGVVQSGLVLNLDAGVSSSYGGSGTTWTDLSGNGNNGTLVNGVGYNASNGGSLSFDGVDDYVTNIAPNLTTAQIEGSLTYEYWLKANSTIYASYTESLSGTSYYGNRSGNGLSGDTYYNYNNSAYAGYQFCFGTNGFVVGVHNNNFAPTILVNYTSYPNICHLVVIKTTNGFSYYINGIFIRSSLSTTRIFGDSLTRITAGLDTNFARSFNGIMYSYKLYNRALTASEISQNFLAMRARFGI